METNLDLRRIDDFVLSLIIDGAISLNDLFLAASMDGWCRTAYGVDRFAETLRLCGFRVDGDEVTV